MRPRLVEPSGMTGGRLSVFLTRNWLVMNGILFGITIDESRIFFLWASKARWPIISSRISLPLHSVIGFFTNSPVFSG